MLAARSEIERGTAAYDYIIVNENFDAAAAELRAIFVAHRLRREAQQQRHAALIERLLKPQGTET